MTAIYLRFHGWRGFALTNAEPDLFHVVFRFGFCTLYVCRRCLLDAYWKLRRTIGDAVDRIDDQHGENGR